LVLGVRVLSQEVYVEPEPVVSDGLGLLELEDSVLPHLFLLLKAGFKIVQFEVFDILVLGLGFKEKIVGCICLDTS
jgi:hypothetical protein